MGAERNHRDRAVRFQGDWAADQGMTDHYTKSKLTITLGMIGALIRDLKSGWRPGPRAAPDLIATVLKAPGPATDVLVASSDEEDPIAAAGNADRDSDASDIATIVAPMIDFYMQQVTINKMLSPDPPKLHVRSLDTPELPACTRLQRAGVKIVDMSWAGNFPGHTNAICAHCRKARPEIMEQLDGHAVEPDDG